MANIRRDAGGPLDDDAALLLLVRQALGGPADAGRASYQVALTVCEKCRCAAQDGRGESVPVDAAVLAMAECDGQHIGIVHAGGTDTDTQTGETDTDAHAGETDTDAQTGETDTDAHAGETDTDAHTRESDGFAHVGAKRATQSIPPAVRRLVLRRDHHCCVFPGCRHATFVDVHHIRSKADGGRHAAENLVTLCCAHHRALHRGDVVVEGSAPLALRFTHSDGTVYGGNPTPVITELRANAFRALRGMGFGEAEVRKALRASAGGFNDPQSLESLLRSALLELTSARVTRAA